MILTLGLEAARILNNLTDQKVNVSKTISLHCDAAGMPDPTVVWTKNNHTVVEGSGETPRYFSVNADPLHRLDAAVNKTSLGSFQV